GSWGIAGDKSISLTDPVPSCSAIESPNARSEKDQSGKSKGVTGHALLKLRISDSAGRTAPNQYDSNTLPEVRSHFHHKRVGLNRNSNRPPWLNSHAASMR